MMMTAQYYTLSQLRLDKSGRIIPEFRSVIVSYNPHIAVVCIQVTPSYHYLSTETQRQRADTPSAQI